MSQTSATILIPDISGFTAFVTNTELSHAAKAINILLDAILKAVGDEYEVAEIEGDAVLLFKKGLPPAKSEIIATCLSIFHSFHYMRAWMELHTLCPCTACQALKNLSLKFIVHHGPTTEMKVGRFVKPSGPDMIVAHRLMKNGIDSDEYVLMTEKIWQHEEGSPDLQGVDWECASEEFASFGKVDYRFAKLDTVRKNEPRPPQPERFEPIDMPPQLEIAIEANYRDVYMVVMDIPGRPAWMPGLQNVEQDIPEVFIGSEHRCTFEQYNAVILPQSMELTSEGIRYVEKRSEPRADINLIYEFDFRGTGDRSSVFAARFIPADGKPLPEDLTARLSNELTAFGEKLKAHCEGLEGSLFESSFTVHSATPHTDF